MTEPPARIYAVVPAAGVGRRMGGEMPKQYLEISGITVLAHTLARLAGHPRIERVVVAVAADDTRYSRVATTLPAKCVAVTGGAERCHSVLAGLHSLAGDAGNDDWVLVHDAARPCLRTTDIDRMLEQLATHAVGGILAVPVRDTLKRGDTTADIVETVDRDGLWQAQTPQMFRLGTLTAAIEAALADAVIVTDEAQAIERQGHRPRLVAGHADNIKITRPEDLALAGLILAAQTGAAGA